MEYSSLKEFHQALYDQAYELASQKALAQEIDYECSCMSTWTTEYYTMLCAENGIMPDATYLE